MVCILHLLQSYSRKHAFVAAQSPIEHTRNDIWELIWQFRTSTIVLLCDIKEGDQVRSIALILLLQSLLYSMPHAPMNNVYNYVNNYDTDTDLMHCMLPLYLSLGKMLPVLARQEDRNG